MIFSQPVKLLHKYHQILEYGGKTAGNDRNENQRRSNNSPPSRKRLRYSRQEKSTDSGNEPSEGKDEATPPPPKKRRPTKYHKGKSCGECTVWLHLGGDPDLKHKHTMGKQNGHPDTKAAAFNSYLSVNGINFELEAESCMCSGCYRDCNRGEGEPRWVNIHRTGTFSPPRHCEVCHYELLYYSPGADSPCKSTKKWVEKPWRQGFTSAFWQKYFIHTRPNFKLNLTESSTLCHKHYMEIYNKTKSHKCKMCLC